MMQYEILHRCNGFVKMSRVWTRLARGITQEYVWGREAYFIARFATIDEAVRMVEKLKEKDGGRYEYKIRQVALSQQGAEHEHQGDED